MKENAVTTESVVIECDLPDPPEKVWRALTEQHLLAAWLGPNDLCPEVGAQFHFKGGRGAASPVHGTVLCAEPNRLLRWRQRESSALDSNPATIESVVSFELAGLPCGGTRLRLVHDAFETRPIVAAAATNAPIASAIVVQLEPRRIRGPSRPKPTSTILCSLGSLRRAA